MTDTTNPKILLLGWGRHGKDTVAELLQKNYGLIACSTSLWAAEHIMMPYFAGIGIDYSSLEECYADRHSDNNRAVWFDQINAWGSEDLTRFSREVLIDHDIFVGMRNAEELKASRKLYDFVAWVDASGRGLPPEDTSSMTIERDDKMWVIQNDGDLEDLEQEVARFARYMDLKSVVSGTLKKEAA